MPTNPKRPSNRCLDTPTDALLSRLPDESSERSGEYNVTSAQTNAADEGWSGHLQGIAHCSIRERRFFATTSAQGGLILSGTVSNNVYKITDQAKVSHGDHPGGIQAIGDCVAVPIYDANASASRSAQVQIWTFNQGKWHHRKVLQLNSDLAYCVGIANRGDDEYLLAVGVDSNGHSVRLYRKKEPLLSNGKFQYIRTVETRKGHPNSISLACDSDGNAYLVGMRLCGFGGIGKDKVDLYKIDNNLLDDSNVKGSTQIKRTGPSRHLSCRTGWHTPSFRWGASMRVLSANEIEIVTCGRDIFRKNDNTLAFEVDVFA